MGSPVAPRHPLPNETRCSHQHRLLMKGPLPLCPEDPRKRPPASLGASWVCVWGDRLMYNLLRRRQGRAGRPQKAPLFPCISHLSSKGNQR